MNDKFQCFRNAHILVWLKNVHKYILYRQLDHADNQRGDEKRTVRILYARQIE